MDKSLLLMTLDELRECEREFEDQYLQHKAALKWTRQDLTRVRYLIGLKEEI